MTDLERSNVEFTSTRWSLVDALRDGEDRPLNITITRDIIRVTSVKSRMLDPGYGYVRISQFQSRTGENLREALVKLEDEADGPLKGLVLDLRNNPGGVLSAAVSVSDAFLKDGIIVYTEGRLEDAKLKFNAKPTDILDGAPLVVLVNGGSASASEIVAGALQDHQRAIIMGQKTFGKGSVQTILPMDNGSALKLTTAKYYTPSGVSIQATGISPDIALENLKLAEWVQEHESRLPIVAFMAGRFMDEMKGMRFGHAGTIVEGKEDTTAEKIKRMEEAGISVAERIEEIPQLIRQSLARKKR